MTPPQQALHRFTLAEQVAQSTGSHHTLALLRANQAWAQACLHQPHPARDLLARATDDFAHADLDHVPPWRRFFTPADLAALIGTVLAQHPDSPTPRHTRTAITALTTAITDYSPDMTRSRALCLTMLATNHLLNGDADHATTVGTHALDLATTLMSSRVIDRLQPLKTLAEHRRDNPHARDLAHHITTVTRHHHTRQAPAAGDPQPLAPSQ